MNVRSPSRGHDLLSDQDVRFILKGTFLCARSVRELSDRYGIPLATCYRKANALRRAGLLRPEREILQSNGRRVTLLKAALPRARISWHLGSVMLTFLPSGAEDEYVGRVGLTLAE